MPREYLPLFVFLILALLFPVVSIAFSKLLRPSAPSRAKGEPYECGIPPTSDSRARYSVRFYLVALLFVIFDVETVLLFPWAVRYRALGWYGVAEVFIFLLILFTGYLWAYRKGVFEWV